MVIGPGPKVLNESIETGEVPLSRVANVRSMRLNQAFLVVVIVDDSAIIPLTRGYSGLYSKKLDQIVDQTRDHIGHTHAMP